MAKKEKIFTLPVIGLILLSFALGTSEFIVVGILPDISGGLGVSLTTAGSLVSVFAFVYAVGTPFTAALAGRFSRFGLITVLTVLFILGNLFCALAPTYGMLTAARILLAVVSGTLISVSMTFVPDVSSLEHRATVVSWVFAGFSLASIFGVPMGTTVSHLLGWRAAFGLITLCSAAVLVILVVSLPRAQQKVPSGLVQQFVLLGDGRILLGIFTVFFGASSAYVLYTYLTPVFEELIGVPASLISPVLLLFGVMVFFSNLISGKMAQRRGIYKLRFSFLVMAAAMFVLPLTLKAAPLALAVIFVIGLVMYLQNSPIQVNILNIATREYPGAITLAASANSFSYNFGIAFGSVCGSLMVDRLDMRLLGLGGGVLALCALVCALLLHGKIGEA
ncbi:MFS transporter [Anaerotignum lactatifermentans]|uniref:MFS transporter n=1 Tax=Anaerotignum lactatifermentans TaxID=160404 RepID=A0ABS2G7B3_9FIRM|nr:MFS transporter [Anaerotignum lactatifermentans]MBM6829032.1 MFS transporter [Anaerotignum lactatifermentans]MBM6877361.1 MFS transporter [Anaerotignum lactatifermentans]MBM6950731.1 MFS transporter [Anaerotignum lactatifermentans]